MEQRRETLTRPAMSNSAEITSIVSNIVNRIRTEGDSNCVSSPRKFDKVSDGDLRLSDRSNSSGL